jgi:hypothetical protein
MENWKDITGYEGVYQISNKGNVRSIERLQWNGNIYHLVPGKPKKQLIGKRAGHHYVILYKNNKMSNKYVHRLVAIEFIENPNNLPNVCHKDNDPSNNSVDNLYWGTQSDNLKQCVKDGRHRNQYY